MAKKLSPIEQKASKTVLNDLRGEAQKLMKGKMDGLKKVTVASNSKEGLNKGLEKAKEILSGNKPESEESCPVCGKEPCECEAEESPEHESSESPELEASEVEPSEGDLSEEEIDAKIQELLKLKGKKKNDSSLA